MKSIVTLDIDGPDLDDYADPVDCICDLYQSLVEGTLTVVRVEVVEELCG